MRDTEAWAGKVPAEHEAIIQRFEEACQGSSRPDLEGFLPEPRPADARLLLELVHIELDFRLRRGEAARVEEYLGRYPELGRDREALLELIAAECALRRYWQGEPPPGEYPRRFPDYGDDLAGRPGGDTDASGRPRSSLAAPGPPLIPGYQILRVLGRGGMGVVYAALQPALGRIVALKTLLPGYQSVAEDIARFRREAEAIARLDCANIVPVYEVGDHDGSPYFSMKFYPGGSLAQRVQGPSGDPGAEARLVETIARAVHHGHQRGVLHRDLKPSNILLDEAGQPHVADFGLAKRFDPSAGATLASGVVGTPSYIAPEQARGNQAVTTATDVYGLGAILYELLTGEPPFRAETALATLAEVEDRPPRRPRLANPRLTADLETICLKCLEKEPARRYPGAMELADDLERWRKGESILARPTTPWERAWRWAKRRPVAAGLGLVTALALVLTVVTLAISNARITAQEGETFRALAQQRRLLYLARVALAGKLWSSNQMPWDDKLDECPPEFRRWEWDFLNSLRRPRHVLNLDQVKQAYALAYSPDGRQIASAGEGGVVKLWNAETGTPVPCSANHGDAVTFLAFHPVDPLLVTAGKTNLKVWNLTTGKEAFRLPGSRWAAFSPDGRYLASAKGKAIMLWEARTGRELHTMPGQVRFVSLGAFSPDSRCLATCGHAVNSAAEGTVQVWDVSTGQPVGEPRHISRATLFLAYGPQGGSLLLGQFSGILETDADTGRVRGAIDSPQSVAIRLAQNSIGYLAYAAPDCTVRVWSLQEGRETFTFRGHKDLVLALAYSPNGRRLASAGADGKIKVWDMTRPHEMRVLHRPDGRYDGFLPPYSDGTKYSGLAFSPPPSPKAAGGERKVKGLATAPSRDNRPADNDDLVSLLDPTTGKVVLQLRGRNAVVFSTDGRRMATGSPEGGVTLYDTGTGGELRRLGGRGGASRPEEAGKAKVHYCRRLAFRHDGRRLASGGTDGTLQIWDPESGELIRSWRAHARAVEGMAFSPNGALLATAGGDGVHLWDAATGVRIHTLGRPSDSRTVAFSPDGRLLATGGWGRVIHLWDASTGELLRLLHGHTLAVWSLAFSPDGGRLVSGGLDKTVRLWDVESGQELLSLPGVAGRVDRVTFSPNGQRIAATDGDVMVWEAAPSRE